MMLCRWLWHVKRIIGECWQVQVYQQFTAVRMGIGSHPTIPLWGKCGQISDQVTLLIEEVFWVIAAHPLLQDVQVRRIFSHIRNGHLMGAEGPFNGQTIHLFGSRPSFGCPQDNCGPACSLCEAMHAR